MSTKTFLEWYSLACYAIYNQICYRLALTNQFSTSLDSYIFLGYAIVIHKALIPNYIEFRTVLNIMGKTITLRLTIVSLFIFHQLESSIGNEYPNGNYYIFLRSLVTIF